jgi:hypothetical protein
MQSIRELDYFNIKSEAAILKSHILKAILQSCPCLCLLWLAVDME